MRQKAMGVLKFMGLESYAGWLAFGLPYGILKKIEIARAVEELFKVEVKAVNTVSMKAKSKRMGYHIGKTGEWKKAIVTLTEDSKTIAFFDGMN